MAAAAYAMQPILDPLVQASVGRFPFFLLFTGLGIAFGRPTQEREPGRRLALPRFFALCFLFFTCATLLLSPMVRQGPLDGTSGLIAMLAMIGLSGCCAGQMLRPLVLFVGGRRTLRMHLWNGALTGAALAACTMGVRSVGPATIMVVFLAMKYRIVEKAIIVREITIRFHPIAKATIMERKQLMPRPVTHAKAIPLGLTM